VPGREDAVIDAVVFDLGGVLLDWDPRHLYRRVFDDETEMEQFLAEVVSPAWNHELDLGRPFAAAVDQLAMTYPHHAEAVRAYWERWDDMVPGDLPETVALLEQLVERGVACYGLTNFSPETYPRMQTRFPWLGLLRGTVVSGHEGVGKPDPRAYRLLGERFGIDLGRALFVDDMQANVEGALAVGMHAVRFTGATDLRQVLIEAGLLC
jgi:2-haloacid dehalogenase